MIPAYAPDAAAKAGEYCLNVLARNEDQEFRGAAEIFGGLEKVEELALKFITSHGHAPEDLAELIAQRAVEIRRWRRR